MFLGYQNGKIVLAANTRAELENAPCMTFDRIEESAEEYVLYKGEYLTALAAAARQAADEKAAHLADLQAQLDELDLKAIRALRALSAGTGTEADKDKLEQLESAADTIRAEIRELAV